LKMVKGGEDGTYKDLKERFNILMVKSHKKQTNQVELEEVIPDNYEGNPEYNGTEYPIIHNPKETVRLLNFFTQNDKHLKYSTHSWEKGKYNSYDHFMECLKEDWKKINKSLKEISPRLHAKISNFLFNEKLGQKKEKGYNESWGEYKLQFGWSSPQLKTYMDKNPDHDPFTYPIPNEIIKKEKLELNYFKDYAEVFKNEIEFREDSKNLRKAVS
ncbi:MAG: hypothetical protein NC927_01305, partial [Candidatus Omnitrophica bacterium]|nr:hypothetical protein [Candidatus Omnitrophota bacterium]